MYEVIAIGSATQDVFVNIDETRIVRWEDERASRAFLALDYGAKIPVDSLMIDTGGGAVNTAVSFARMGMKAATLCKMGQDRPGREIAERLQEENVDTSLLIYSAQHDTGFSVIITGFTGDRTILVHRGASTELSEAEIPWDLLTQSKWLYIGSMAGAAAPLFNKLAIFGGQHGLKVAVNPGSTQLRAGLEALCEALEHTTAIFLNKTEAYRLTGVSPDRGPADEREMLRLLCAAGCDNVIITAGAEGSEGYDGQAHYAIPAYRTEVVSTVGAGDAFAAACTVGLHHGLPLNEAMLIGAANAASVVGKFGAKEGILTWQQALDFIAARRGSISGE